MFAQAKQRVVLKTSSKCWLLEFGKEKRSSLERERLRQTLSMKVKCISFTWHNMFVPEISAGDDAVVDRTWYADWCWILEEELEDQDREQLVKWPWCWDSLAKDGATVGMTWGFDMARAAREAEQYLKADYTEQPLQAMQYDEWLEARS
jgi:hypothetical protein